MPPKLTGLWVLNQIPVVIRPYVHNINNLRLLNSCSLYFSRCSKTVVNRTWNLFDLYLGPGLYLGSSCQPTMLSCLPQVIPPTPAQNRQCQSSGFPSPQPSSHSLFTDLWPSVLTSLLFGIFISFLHMSDVRLLLAYRQLPSFLASSFLLRTWVMVKQ